MPIQHTAATLVQKQWHGHCFECGQNIAHAAPEAVWTIWTATLYYCAACAKEDVSAQMIPDLQVLPFRSAA